MQPTERNFADALNEAEMKIAEMERFASRLADRLVGYADTDEVGFGEDPTPGGVLPSIRAQASRLERNARGIRAALDRIEQALPSEVIKAASVNLSGIPRSQRIQG